MDTILGIRGPTFVMLAADTTQARSIVVMKQGKQQQNLSTISIMTQRKLRNLELKEFYFFQMKIKYTKYPII